MNAFNNKKLYFVDRSGKSLAIFLKNKCTVIDKKIVDDLILFSKKNNFEDVRICMHNNKQAKLQNMINLTFKSVKSINFHKHLKKDETYQIIRGRMIIEYFSKKKVKKIELGKNNILFRINKNIFHRIKPVTNYIVYHEIRQGPFIKNDSIFFSKKYFKSNLG